MQWYDILASNDLPPERWCYLVGRECKPYFVLMKDLLLNHLGQLVLVVAYMTYKGVKCIADLAMYP